MFQNSTAIEPGIYDHHKLVVTVMKVYSEKQKPITVNYRSYKNFEMFNFNEELKEALENFEKPHMTYEDFKTIFIKILEKHAPKKSKKKRSQRRLCIAQN